MAFRALWIISDMGLLSTIGGALGSFFGPVGTAIGSAAGGMLDSDMAQDEANKFSSAQAAANRDWQERMSNTSYQRGMADMRAAGLNPMLAYSQGGASVPNGATATYPGAVGAQYRMADASISSAEAAVQQADTATRIGNSTVEKIKQEVANLQSVNDQVKAITLNLGQEYQNLVKEGYNKTEAGNLLRAQIERIRAEIPKINSDVWRNEAATALDNMLTRLRGLDVAAGEKMDNIGRELQQLGPIIELLKIFLLRRN